MGAWAGGGQHLTRSPLAAGNVDHRLLIGRGKAIEIAVRLLAGEPAKVVCLFLLTRVEGRLAASHWSNRQSAQASARQINTFLIMVVRLAARRRPEFSETRQRRCNCGRRIDNPASRIRVIAPGDMSFTCPLARTPGSTG